MNRVPQRRRHRWPPRAQPARPAVTLLELLLVVSVLSLLAAFLWPEFSGAARGEQLDESARRLRSLVAMCRAEAMNNARLYHIVIRPDGSLKLRQQVDPIQSPQLYGPVKTDWARLAFLLEDVWVESVLALPAGPPPVLVEDTLIQAGDKGFDFEMNLIPTRVEELEEPVVIEFRPDGTSDSLRWVLRDVRGRGVQMTLDGRLGRIATEAVAPLPSESIERPPAFEDVELEEEFVEASAGQRRR